MLAEHLYDKKIVTQIVSMIINHKFVAQLSKIANYVTKSTGVDDISARMLKYCAYYSIAPSLTKLFNLSLISGTFPSEWKAARIVPIPKTDSPSVSASDYRPISILPVVSKVLERHVKEFIEEHVAENAPISKHQWGFMHHRSSTSA